MGLQEIANLSESQFVDLFNTDSPSETTPPPINTNNNSGGFSAFQRNTDIFSSTTDTTTIPATTDTTTVASTTDTTTLIDSVDILNTEDEEKKGAGRPPKYDFSDMSGYIKDRVEKGVFRPLVTENEKGEEIPFIPANPEEVDEFINFQVDNKFEEAKKEVENTWYAEKSPVWKFVANYADKIHNPAELLPMLQGISNMQTIASIDENQPEGAEAIIRINYEASGMSKTLIDKQVEALKTTNSILEAAKELKPEMVKAEQQKLVQLDQQKETELNEYRNTIAAIRDNAIKVIEAPIGKEKLKQEEKAAIYDLIAVPNPETRGYTIFNKIDELFDKKDFEKLRKIALLLTNEESFIKYLTNEELNKSALALEKKIRVAGEKGSGKDTQNNTPSKNVQPVQKPLGNRTVRFGRG